jgi:hypothetical protein
MVMIENTLQHCLERKRNVYKNLNYQATIIIAVIADSYTIP